jgi:hypothetical protein
VVGIPRLDGASGSDPLLEAIRPGAGVVVGVLGVVVVVVVVEVVVVVVGTAACVTTWGGAVVAVGAGSVVTVVGGVARVTTVVGGTEKRNGRTEWEWPVAAFNLTGGASGPSWDDASTNLSGVDATPWGPPEKRSRQVINAVASAPERAGARRRRHGATGRACLGPLRAAICRGSRLARCNCEVGLYPRPED